MNHDDPAYNDQHADKHDDAPGHGPAISDAEFDAFLRGDDALARQLATLPQPQPSATLDAAILRHVQADLRRPVASNDAARRGIVSRWSMPIALAASFVVTFSLLHEWDGYISDAPAEVAAPVVVAPAAPAAPAAAEPAATVPATPPPPPFIAPPSRPAPLRKPAPPAPAAPNPAPELSGVLAAPLAAAQAETPSANSDSAAEKLSLPLRRSAPAPAPAPPAAVSIHSARTMAPRAVGEDNVSADGIKTDNVKTDSLKVDNIKADNIKADNIKADNWLAVIDAMLNAGLPRDAREEWARFRLAYPGYPVPPALLDRIKAAPP